MSSFGGARPKTSFKSSKKQKKSKRKDRRDEKEEDAMPFDKEKVKDEMISRNPRRMQKEMLADSPNKGTHPIGILENPNNFRNTSDVDQILCSIPYSPKKISLPKDASGNINYSGNSSQYEREEGERGAEGRRSGNLENASQKKVYEVNSDCHLASSSNLFFKEMETISKSLEIASREYREKSFPNSCSPFPPRFDIRVKKTHPVLDVNEQTSKVSEKRSKQGKNEVQVELEEEDEISGVLEEDEMIKEFKGNKVPPRAYHVQNKRPDPIEHADNQDKSSSKESEKMKKLKDGKSETTEDKDVEIPVVLEKRAEIRTVLLKENEILTEDEDEILAVREGEVELTTTLEEDDILALLEETDEIEEVLEDDLMKIFRNERVPPLTHHLHNSEKREISSPTHRSSTPFPRTSSDQTLLDSIGRVDNQDERNSKGSKKKLERNEDENDEMKEAFEKEKVLPSLLSSNNINEDGKCEDDRNGSEGSEKSDFPSIKYDFSKYVLLWNRWSLISEEAIHKAVKTISPCSRLRLKSSSYSSIWSYGIVTFACLKNAKLCVNFFKGFTVKLKSLVDELKPLMDKEKRVMIESMQFNDGETLVVAETIFTWLNYIKILETETREFNQVEKIVIVKNRRIARESLLIIFSFFGEISTIRSFRVSKEIMFSEHEITFVRLFEACAAVFAIDSHEWLQNIFPMSLSMNFEFFASRIERHFYSHLSSSFPLADIFSVLRFNMMQNQAVNISQDSSEEGQQTEVGTSEGSSEGQQTEVGTSEGSSEEGQQTKVDISQGGSKEGQQTEVGTSGGGEGQQTEFGTSQGSSEEGQQTEVETSGGSEGQQTEVGTSGGGEEGQQTEVGTSEGGNEGGQQKKFGTSQGYSKEQKKKVEVSQEGNKEKQQMKVGASPGGSEGGAQTNVETSQGGSKGGQQIKIGTLQGVSEEEQQTKAGTSQGVSEEGHQLDVKSILTQVCKKDERQLSVNAKTAEVYKGEPESYEKEKPSEMKERGQVMGEIHSPSFQRNETSAEGKSPQSEKLNQPNGEKSQRNNAESNPIEKSKRKGKKKRRRR